MRRGFRLPLASLLVFSLCGAGFSAEKAAIKSSAAPAAQKSQQNNPKKAPKLVKYRGNISAIDSSSGAVSVNGAAGEKQFITQDAAKDAVERLAVGDSVRVIYSEKNGKLVASSVRRIKLTKSSARREKTTENTLAQPHKASQAGAK